MLAQMNKIQDCSKCRLPSADEMADFALESQGASVIMSRCSPTYTSTSARLTLFGIPLWRLYRGPRTVIQGALMLPGVCWPFVGSKGTLGVSLSHPIRITHVTLEHVSLSNSPTGEIKSAPKDFEVYGIKSQPEEETFLGSFMYDCRGEQSQTFTLQDPTEKVYDAVELHVLSNWGQEEYTCLYRFRVHGHIAPVS
ncbi:SUN domain-containing protein 2-like [Takifugu flavidus]|nr:SUN domain-containing protein 2-like [Takifugu flavidus]